MLNTKGVTFLLTMVYYEYLIRIVLNHFRYSVLVPGADHSTQYNCNLNEWFHSVINFIGPNIGQGYIVYVDGIKHGCSGSGQFTPGVINNGRIAVGRQFIQNNKLIAYTSFAVDELLFFNQTLNETEIRMLSQTT